VFNSKVSEKVIIVVVNPPRVLPQIRCIMYKLVSVDEKFS
jgi:hypothetical protein